MPVLSSTHTIGHPQKNGRRYITERHVLDTGGVIVREYGPVEEIDYVAVAAAQAAQIEADAEAQIVAEALAGEEAAAREKVVMVLAEAEQAGAITEKELALAGLGAAAKAGK